MTKSWNEFEDLIKSMNTEEDFDKLKIGSDFSAKLVKARLSKKLTQNELAFRAGLKQSAIARIENQGSLPRLDTVYKIAEAMDCEIDFYPVNYEYDNHQMVQDFNDRILNLQSIIANLIKQINSLTDAVNTIGKPQVIVHIARQQPSTIKDLGDLQSIMQLNFDDSNYHKTLELTQRGVEWGDV